MEERNDDTIWDDTKGCRGSKQIKKAEKYKKSKNPHKKTGGVFGIRTASGFVLELKIIHKRETPTNVILDYAKYFTSTADRINYFDRMVGLGYDMACKIIYRLITLFVGYMLPVNYLICWLLIIGSMFIDKMHITGHTNDALCTLGNILNPYSPRWKTILHGTNTQVAEQYWQKLNRFRFFLRLGNDKAKFWLLLFKQWCNEKQYHAMKNAGYTFIPIESIKPLRSFSTTLIKYQNMNIKKIKTPTIKQLKAIKKLQTLQLSESYNLAN